MWDVELITIMIKGSLSLLEVKLCSTDSNSAVDNFSRLHD